MMKNDDGVLEHTDWERALFVAARKVANLANINCYYFLFHFFF